MAKYLQLNNQSFSVGDTVKVNLNVKDGDKNRIQIFEGIIIAIDNRLQGKAFTVRKIGANGIGVEKIIPLNSPVLAGMDMVSQGDVRRAKLFYMRTRIGKKASKVKQKILRQEE